jgi:hypothetical protein
VVAGLVRRRHAILLQSLAGITRGWIGPFAGDASPPFPASEMDQRNDNALARIGVISGPEAISEFAEVATAYLDRATDLWNLAYGYPLWDGARRVALRRGRHRVAPSCMGPVTRLGAPPSATGPPGIVHRSGTCLAEARGGLGGAVLRLLVPLGTRSNPWSTILRRSGRSPAPAGMSERG